MYIYKTEKGIWRWGWEHESREIILSIKHMVSLGATNCLNGLIERITTCVYYQALQTWKYHGTGRI